MNKQVRKGIVYFQSYTDARAFGKENCKDYPLWRTVAYKLGWAIQSEPGGNYFGPDGKTSNA